MSNEAVEQIKAQNDILRSQLDVHNARWKIYEDENARLAQEKVHFRVACNLSQAELQKLNAQLQDVQNALAAEKAEHEKTKEQLANTINNYNLLNSEHSKLSADFNTLNDQYNAVTVPDAPAV